MQNLMKDPAFARAYNEAEDAQLLHELQEFRSKGSTPAAKVVRVSQQPHAGAPTATGDKAASSRFRQEQERRRAGARAPALPTGDMASSKSPPSNDNITAQRGGNDPTTSTSSTSNTKNNSGADGAGDDDDEHLGEQSEDQRAQAIVMGQVVERRTDGPAIPPQPVAAAFPSIVHRSQLTTKRPLGRRSGPLQHVPLAAAPPLASEQVPAESVALPPVAAEVVASTADRSRLTTSRLELEKMAWLGDADQVATPAGAASAVVQRRERRRLLVGLVFPVYEWRFDLTGARLSEADSATLPTHLGLHHHANDADLAGYTLDELVHLARSRVPTQRVLAMQVLTGIVRRAKTGALGSRAVCLTLLRALLDCNLVFAVRIALDAAFASLVCQGVLALHALLAPSAEAAQLAQVGRLCYRGHETAGFACSADQRDAALEEPTDAAADEAAEPAEFRLVRVDLIAGLVAMDVIVRLRYLLQSPEPALVAVAPLIVDALCVLAQHSVGTACAIYDTAGLIDELWDRWLLADAPSGADLDAFRRTQVVSVRLATLLCAAGRELARRVVEDGRLECTKRFLVLTVSQGDASAAAHLAALQRESLLGWRTAIAYGFDSPPLATYVGPLMTLVLAGCAEGAEPAAVAVAAAAIGLFEGAVHVPHDTFAVTAPLVSECVRLLGNLTAAPQASALDDRAAIIACILHFAASYLLRLPAQPSYVALDALAYCEHLLVVYLLPLLRSAWWSECIASPAAAQAMARALYGRPRAEHSDDGSLVFKPLPFAWPMDDSYEDDTPDAVTHAGARALARCDALTGLARLLLVAGGLHRGLPALLAQHCAGALDGLALACNALGAEPRAQADTATLRLIRPMTLASYHSLKLLLRYRTALSPALAADVARPGRLAALALRLCSDLCPGDEVYLQDCLASLVLPVEALADLASGDAAGAAAAHEALFEYLFTFSSLARAMRAAVPLAEHDCRASESCLVQAHASELPLAIDWLTLAVQDAFAEAVQAPAVTGLSLEEPVRNAEEAAQARADAALAEQEAAERHTHACARLRATLWLILAADSAGSAYVRSIPSAVLHVRMLQLFVGGKTLFLEPGMGPQLQRVLVDIILRNQGFDRALNCVAAAGSLALFRPVFKAVLEHYFGCSYGDNAFSLYLLTFLHRDTPVELRIMWWTEYIATPTTIAHDVQALVDRPSLWQPRETEPELLRLWQEGLRTRAVCAQRCELFLRLAMHHVGTDSGGNE